MDLFLTLFERQMKLLNPGKDLWVLYLIGALPSDVTSLIAREPEEKCRDYSHIRGMLLQRFKYSVVIESSPGRSVCSFKHAAYATREPQLGHPASEKFSLIELIPMYDRSESLGIRRFLGKINDVAELGGWSNAEKVTILKLKLAGIAEEFFLSDPTQSHLSEYNDIIRVLITRFERTVPLSTRLQLFSSCIQGSSESVQEFAARNNKLGTQIFQSSNSVLTTAARNANDQLLQSRFISGLRNDIRRFVLARDPNTLEESINAALIEEQNLKLNEIASNERSGLSSLTTEPPVISAFTDKLQELRLRVESLQEASTVIARETSKCEFHRKVNVFKCFYCGLEGHRQAECRKRVADQRPWNSPRFRRSVRDETPVSRSSRLQPVNQRRVRFEDSTLRRFPPVSQRNFRDRGNAGVFRQNRKN
ncbi:uncharacterized protein TNCV_507981 [Trichonephila clavipes]|nr:uncharacterized protein TNCV_507981 [Trichonephila clavipes]